MAVFIPVQRTNINLPAKVLLVTFLLLHTFLAAAQIFTVHGSVKSSTDSLVNGGVLIISKTNGTLLKTGVIENGKFMFQCDSSELVLRLSVMGYADTDIYINNTAGDALINAGQIFLQENQALAEVMISAKTPLYVRTTEGNKINVEHTMLSTSTSMTELLSKSPGISVAGNKVSLFGRGEALIYMKGRQITLEQLQSIPPGQVVSIEIISNPSAKYDARGRAVINVILKKNNEEGTSGTLQETATFGKHFLNSGSTSISYRKKSLTITGDYTLNLGKDWNENNYGVTYDLPTGLYKSSSYYEEHTRSKNVSGYRLGMGYEIDKRTDMSLQYDGQYNLFSLAVANQSDIYSQSGTKTVVHMVNDGKTKNENHSLNFNLNRKIDTFGGSIFIGGQYNSFDNVLYDQINEHILYADNTMSNGRRINDGNNRITLITLQADINKQINHIKVDAGIKYNNTVNDSRIIFMTKKEYDADWAVNQAFGNSFLYNEYVTAAYAMVSGKYKKVTYTAGCRAEMSDVRGYSRKYDQIVFDTSYLNFFPNAQIGYAITDKWSTTFSYAHRINRPLYQDIDPFVWYIDSLTSIAGNSGLRPDYVHSFEWSASYNTFTLKVGYAYTNSSIRSVAKTGVSGPNSVVFTKDNMQHYEQYTVSLDIPIEKKYLTSYNTFTCNFNHLIDARPGYMTRPLSPLLYISTYNQIPVFKICSMDISGEYYGTGSDGMTVKTRPYYYVSAGISKSFFDKKMSCQVLWNDIFRSAQNVGDKTIGVINNYFHQRFNTAFLRLTINYQFGITGGRAYNNRAVNTAEYNRIKK